MNNSGYKVGYNSLYSTTVSALHGHQRRNNKANTMSSPPKIAIIGAGIAGLSCARELQQAGIHVQLFEKSKGPSGRMSTRRGPDWQCDHGAQYFTAQHPDFKAEVSRWQAAGIAQAWEPRLKVFEEQPRHHKPNPVIRYVGTPTMTAPAQHLAQGLNIQPQVMPKTFGWD